MCFGENPNHMVFHIDTNDIPSKKTPETKAKWILNLATSSKSNTCGVSILSIFIRKDKYQQKAQEVNGYLKELCKEFNIHYIYHEKSTKSKRLNKSRLHLNKRGTSILSRNFMREISNVFR